MKIENKKIVWTLLTLVMILLLVMTSTKTIDSLKLKGRKDVLNYRERVTALSERAKWYKFRNIDSYYDKEKKLIDDWFAVKVSWYGDSLTNQYKFCKIVDRYFGFIGHNSGISDTTVASINDSSMCKPIRMQYQDESRLSELSEVIFIMAGVNDWMHNIEMGDAQVSFDNTNKGILEDVSFSGACNQMFYYLKKYYPNARIIVLGTPFCSGEHYDVFKGEDKSFNDLGYTSLDYGRKLCEIASMWGIENINVGDKLDWNQENILQYSEDGIHFNDGEGSEMVAQVIIDYIESLD